MNIFLYVMIVLAVFFLAMISVNLCHIKMALEQRNKQGLTLIDMLATLRDTIREINKVL